MFGETGAQLGLDEKGVQVMLESGDRAMDIGESGLEVGEDLCGRQTRGIAWQPGRHLWRRAAST